YVFFLATIYKLFGHHYRVVRMIQALLGVILIWILMQITDELGWNPHVRWAAACMTACYPFFIYYENQLLADAYLTFWHAAALLFGLRWIKQPASLGRAVLAGAAFAILVLIKSIFAPLFALIFCGVAYRAWRYHIHPRPWISFLACSFIFILPLSLWGFRNQRIFGRFFLDSHGGRTMIETIVYHDQCKDETFLTMWSNLPLRKMTESMKEAEADAFFLAYT